MDVFWFRLSRRADDPAATMGRIDAGRIFVLINRGQYWQCGFVIAKGSAEVRRQRGIDAFREEIAAHTPFLRDRVSRELASWDDVKLLTVKVDRLVQWWRAGLLCIGDAAHAMSPVGGVGINLAIQDAVAAANILSAPLREGRLTSRHLQQVQARRRLATSIVQRVQLIMQRRVIAAVLASSGTLSPPLPLRVISRVPLLRRLVGRILGLGVRPEHVRISEGR